jgi:hypothetical protein
VVHNQQALDRAHVSDKDHSSRPLQMGTWPKSNAAAKSSADTWVLVNLIQATFLHNSCNETATITHTRIFIKSR